MKITWKKQPSETGLARVCQAPRGADLRIDGVRVMSVRPAGRGLGRSVSGWYWYGSSEALGIPHTNTCDTPLPTLEEAKAACEASVREALGIPKRVRKSA